MSELLGSIWWLVVALGLLVTFHEFGHFWVARRCGVKVLRFSVGFGRALWKRTGRDGTEYVIAMLPLGGYVKMLDEREQDIPPELAGQAFNRKSVWQRIAIVAAGPAANLLLCVGLLWAMFVIGRPDYAPVVGEVQGIAAEAGLQRGDTVLAVGERATPTWSEVHMALIPAALDRADVPLTLQAGDSASPRSLSLPLSRLPAEIDERRVLQEIGLAPRHMSVPPVIGRVEPGSASWGMLAEGDRITAVDATAVDEWSDIGPLVQALGRRGGHAMVEVERDGERLALEIEPARVDGDSGPRWVLGVAAARPQLPDKDALLRHGPIDAVPAAIAEGWHQAGELVAMIGRAFTGRVAVENTVAGPVTIARAANAYADQGAAWFLSLLALLSLSLGILNLLPIPVLDGGHLLYYLIELVKGSPVSERAMVVGQYIGLALVAALMGLAFYNDIINNLVR